MGSPKVLTGSTLCFHSISWGENVRHGAIPLVVEVSIQLVSPASGESDQQPAGQDDDEQITPNDVLAKGS
jgi:hypothetical protein